MRQEVTADPYTHTHIASWLCNILLNKTRIVNFYVQYILYVICAFIFYFKTTHTPPTQQNRSITPALEGDSAPSLRHTQFLYLIHHLSQLQIHLSRFNQRIPPPPHCCIAYTYLETIPYVVRSACHTRRNLRFAMRVAAAAAHFNRPRVAASSGRTPSERAARTPPGRPARATG